MATSVVAHTRTTDPVTSHSAALSVRVTENQQHVLNVLRNEGPMTDVQLVRRYNYWHGAVVNMPRQSESGIRTRRAELVDKGLVRALIDDEGEYVTQRLPSGRQAILWEAV